ncbi:MAG: hypothetical protein N3G21_01230 [Candidatus Hydrogenedentes bacterium]|nr:hypothetical protein [Candidatus Hydrogenedentota bacterium]
MLQIKKEDLRNANNFKQTLSNFIEKQKQDILQKYNVYFETDELGDLLLSACRANDFNVVTSPTCNKNFINEENLLLWIHNKLIPNTVILKIDDIDIIKLLIFCIEITYQMFSGGTKATISAKGFRERRRTFETILVDQFTGKLGEVMLKKFLEKTSPKIKIDLDWKISREIEKYRTDIINAEKKISIKSSPSLVGIWAEADIGYDYGIMVKCSIPRQPILQFFIEVCGFTKLLNFAEDKISSSPDNLFSDYINKIRERIKKYKCGEIQTDLKAFICGYFNTEKLSPIEKGVKLDYLGEVREKRYLVRVNELKWSTEDWKNFIEEAKFHNPPISKTI